jgi:hypothetical protein
MEKEKTVGELYGPAMEITEQADADRYLETLIQRHMAKWAAPHDEAERSVRGQSRVLRGLLQRGNSRPCRASICLRPPCFWGDQKERDVAPSSNTRVGKPSGVADHYVLTGLWPRAVNGERKHERL